MADTLTLTNQIPVYCNGGGGTSSGEVMYVTLTRVPNEETSEYDFYIDKSYNELREAIDSGKLIVSKEIINVEDMGVDGFQFKPLTGLVHRSLDSTTPYSADFGNIEVFATSPNDPMDSLAGRTE